METLACGGLGQTLSGRHPQEIRSGVKDSAVPSGGRAGRHAVTLRRKNT